MKSFVRNLKRMPVSNFHSHTTLWLFICDIISNRYGGRMMANLYTVAQGWSMFCILDIIDKLFGSWFGVVLSNVNLFCVIIQENGFVYFKYAG